MSTTGKYTYDSPFPLCAMSLTNDDKGKFSVAVGSYQDKETQLLQILEPDGDTDRLKVVAEEPTQFPPTKILWKPPAQAATSEKSSGQPRLDISGSGLFATSSNGIFIWKYDADKGTLKSIANLNTGKVIPLTGFDWNMFNHQKIVGCSVDTTCTIWDVERCRVESQLIAHDKPVLDVTWGTRWSTHPLFATVGEDGSCRIFDSRALEHSTIIYETSPAKPLTRLAWNPIDKNYFACIGLDQAQVTILDVRRPGVARDQLSTGGSCPNTIAWSPNSAKHVMCGLEDGNTMIFQLTVGLDEEVSVYGLQGQSSVQHLQWSMHKETPDRVGLLRTSSVEVLKL